MWNSHPSHRNENQQGHLFSLWLEAKFKQSSPKPTLLHLSQRGAESVVEVELREGLPLPQENFCRSSLKDAILKHFK